MNAILDALKIDSYADPGTDWGAVELAPVLAELWMTPISGACCPKTPWSTGTYSIPS